MADGVKRYDTDFKKVAGTVSITDGHIYWTPKEVGTMDRQGQSMARITSEFTVEQVANPQIC